MRILFDSKSLTHKIPFGTLVPDQTCVLNIHIPIHVGTQKVVCILKSDDGTTTLQEIPVVKKVTAAPYEIWSCEFAIPHPGLFFY